MVVVLWLAGSLGAEEVYKSNFQDGASAEIWSSTNTYKIPDSEETALGQFRYQGSTGMHLDGLPEHQMVRLRFDLLLFGDWRGERGERTLDGISIGQNDGPLLFTSNFSTLDGAGDNRQFYPDEYPVATNPAQTGSIGKDGQHRYHFDMTFPHSGAQLGLYFRGRVHDKESGWGFAEVRVDVLDKPNALPADGAKALWAALGGKDAVAAHRAAWDLIGCGKAGLEAVEKHWGAELERRNKIVAEKTAAAAKIYTAELSGLGDDDFVARQQAAAAIGKLGPVALPLIEKSLADKALDAGVRTQLKRVKTRLEKMAAGGDGSIAGALGGRVAQVLRVLDQDRIGMRVSSSRDENPNGWDAVKAVIDGYVPPSSDTVVCPRFSWYPKFIGNGWLRIDFPAEREISKLGVFWFYAGWGTQAPASWKIDYLDADGKTWKPVSKPEPGAGKFGVEPDKFNEVAFDKVRTRAVKITATFNGKKSTGVFEVFVK